MIVDKLQNLPKYFSKYPKLLETVRQNTKVGVYEYDSYRIIVEDTQTFDNNTAECHQIYSDIHIIQQGSEILEYYDIKNVETISNSYNLYNDYTLFTPTGPCISSVLLYPGLFVYFSPREVHIPLKNPRGRSENIRKTVVKLDEN